MSWFSKMIKGKSEEKAAAGAPAPAPRNGKKVLVVDDKASMVRVIQATLSGAGYATVGAFNGQEALRRVELDKPDAIILDIDMPIKDGFETLKELKANPASKNIPVIMLTARQADSDAFKGWKFGAEMFLNKPLNPDELISRVNEILNFRSSASKKHADGQDFYNL